MSDEVVLLVEDDDDDETKTVRALQRCHPANPLVVAGDEAEALTTFLAEERTPAVILAS